jgi:hypothetical protein
MPVALRRPVFSCALGTGAPRAIRGHLAEHQRYQADMNVRASSIAQIIIERAAAKLAHEEQQLQTANRELTARTSAIRALTQEKVELAATLGIMRQMAEELRNALAKANEKNKRLTEFILKQAIHGRTRIEASTQKFLPNSMTRRRGHAPR